MPHFLLHSQIVSYCFLILVFFIIYSVEHSIKIVGLGIVVFFSEFWNQYDLISVKIYKKIIVSIIRIVCF